VIELQLKRHNFPAIGIISVASRHSKDVREFWWGMHGLGAISLYEKAQILVTSLPDLTESYKRRRK